MEEKYKSRINYHNLLQTKNFKNFKKLKKIDLLLIISCCEIDYVNIFINYKKKTKYDLLLIIDNYINTNNNFKNNRYTSHYFNK